MEHEKVFITDFSNYICMCIGIYTYKYVYIPLYMYIWYKHTCTHYFSIIRLRPYYLFFLYKME